MRKMDDRARIKNTYSRKLARNLSRRGRYGGRGGEGDR
jgi:hypothetical protein